MRLENKICVITGGTSGIGRPTVQRFVQEGAMGLSCNPDRRNVPGVRVDRDRLRELAALHYPGEARFYCCDVSKEDEIREMAEFVMREFGPCEVLFNNAGAHQTGKLHETTPENWDRIMNVDVRGVYLCSYYFLPQMLAQHYGTIINMSSVSGLLGDTDMVAYNTAKGAITNMTRCMAIDYAKDGIRVNAICPGAVETEILLHTFHSVPGAEEKFNNAYPTGHVGTAVEIANACVFLASRECDFLNGVNLPIDGGITAHTGQPYMGNY